jgi:NADPH-dependent glutamate synthase beta subunit-like oxidoreductase
VPSTSGSSFLRKVDPVLRRDEQKAQIETNRWGNIVVDDNGKTSMDRIYAGGDIVLGAATVILAMGEGRRAAESINELLTDS